MNIVCGETRYSDSPNSPHGLNIASPTGRGPSTNVFTTNMAILRSAKGADMPIRYNGVRIFRLLVSSILDACHVGT